MIARVLLVALFVVGCGGHKTKTKTAGDTKQKKADAHAMLSQARDAAKSGDTDEADKDYEQAYALDKQFDILEERVDFLIHAGRSGKALEQAKAYYDANATDAKGYKLYAEALLANNKASEALEIADQIIALDDKDPAGHEKKGRAQLLLEKNEEGIEQLRKAVELDGDSATYHEALGLALHKLGKIDEAALEFRAALKRAPDDAEAHVLLGMALRDQSEFDEAKSYLEKAIELDSKNGHAYFELGRLYNMQQKQDDAEKAFAKAVKLSPHESLYWYAYGEIFRVRGDHEDDAIDAYKKAVDIDPPYPKALTKLATMYIAAKRYDDAEMLLTTAVRRDAKVAGNYYQLGVVYAAKKKNRQAVENYKKYLELAPKTDAEKDERAHAKEQISELSRK